MTSRRFVRRLLNRVFRRVSANGNADFSVLVDIIVDKAFQGDPGRSKYSQERRARAIARCPRCLRCQPGFYFTKKCDGVSCVPNNPNSSVLAFVKYGVKYDRLPVRLK